MPLALVSALHKVGFSATCSPSGPAKSSKTSRPRSSDAPSALSRCGNSSSACSRCRVPRQPRVPVLEHLCSWTWSSTASETVCALLLQWPQPAPSSLLILAGQAGRVQPEQSHKRVCCEGAPITLASLPQQSLTRVRPGPAPRARPGEASGRGVRMGVHFLGPAYTAFVTPFLAGKRARKPRPYGGISKSVALPIHHSIHGPPAGQLCPKPASGTPQKPRAPLPAQLSPHRASARADSPFSKAEPRQRSRKFSHLPLRLPSWEPHADPAREAKKPGGLPSNLCSRRVRCPLLSLLQSSSSPSGSLPPRRGNFFLD